MNATTQQCVTNNTINTHLRNLRRKVKVIDSDFDAIKNEYGFGYRWVGK
jgi:DNA-binding response OmpR family regulator